MIRNRLITVTGWLAALTVLIWLGGFLAFLVLISTLDPSPIQQRTDAIIVLTGGPDRINTGLDLLDGGAASTLFITGVDERVNEDTLFSLWRAPEENSKKKQPCCIVLGHQARNTTENAIEAGQWADSRDIRSLRLVTSEYHIPRAWLEFRRFLPQYEIILHPVPSKLNRKALGRLAFGEYNKTLLTYFRQLLEALLKKAQQPTNG